MPFHSSSRAVPSEEELKINICKRTWYQMQWPIKHNAKKQ